ncbi:MAG: geranylgeranyl reductase family protein [Acidimicrobiia bacterium]|nr:geranylgeranyl reductase family protein [Acidimicrobiia bacterium]
MTDRPDVLVVGGGPGGSSAAHWLARNGVSVMLVEKKEYPRVKTCGDGLTPRSITQLTDMGFDFSGPEFHRTRGLRAYSGDLFLEVDWPDHPIHPNWGGVIRRADLDHQVAALAEKQGVVLRPHTTARPMLEDGRIAGVELTSGDETEIVRPRIVVVADGSLSRFGRALGAHRDREFPYGLAARGYFESPVSTDDYMETQLDLRDKAGATVPGYGWIFPLGDGTINVGVGVLSTFHRWKSINTSDLMETLVASAPAHWGIGPDDAVSDPRGGKLPMAFSVGPVVGPNWVMAGDAAGSINPFNGEGIAYAYETGRIAARHVAEALATDDLARLRDYPVELEAEYGLYYRTARAWVRLAGQPGAMRALTRVGVRSRTVMEWTIRVMANLLRPDERGAAERAYGVIERVVQVGPEP